MGCIVQVVVYYGGFCYIMKINQEECAPLAFESLSPRKHPKSSLQGCSLNADVVVMLIAFTILVCCAFSLSYGETIFATSKILQKNYKFLEMGSEQAGNARKEGPSQQKHNWFVFPDLSEKVIEQAIVKKELEVGQLNTEAQQKWEKEKQTRISFFKEKSKIAELESLKHLIVNLGGQQEVVKELNEKQELIYKLRYKIDKYAQELPFCVVVYSRDYKTEEPLHQALLRSVFNQKYSNFRVVFVADGMKPQSLLSLYKFIKKQQLAKQVQVVEVKQKQGYALSMLKALRYSCRSAEVAAFINGNDQLITQHVLSVYNAVYQSKKPKVAYGNFYQYRPTEEQIFMGSSAAYSQQQLESASYREGMPKVGPLLTFNMTLVRYLDESYLKYDENIFYEWQDISLKALSLQLLELSCGKVEYIFQCQYMMSQNKNGLERRQFIRQIHMEPRRCYQYEQAKWIKE